MSNNDKTQYDDDIPVSIALVYFIHVIHTARSHIVAKEGLAKSLGLKSESDSAYEYCKHLFEREMSEEVDAVGLRRNLKTFETIWYMSISDEVDSTEADQLPKSFVFNEWRGGIRKIN